MYYHYKSSKKKKKNKTVENEHVPKLTEICEGPEGHLTIFVFKILLFTSVDIKLPFTGL